MVNQGFRTTAVREACVVREKRCFQRYSKDHARCPAVLILTATGNGIESWEEPDGYVKGFRYETGEDGNPLWQRIEKLFDLCKSGRYASPSW